LTIHVVSLRKKWLYDRSEVAKSQGKRTDPNFTHIPESIFSNLAQQDNIQAAGIPF
jgi:formylmethanofuran dehydrogenase subunit D